jgi:hypothetical protein
VTAIYIIGVGIIGSFVYFLTISVAPMVDMFKNRLLYRLNLSVEELAVVEKCLSRLARVIVMSDRVDDPKLGFLEAVKDNFTCGVKYLFLVSNKSTDEQLDQYRVIFQEIEIAVRAEGHARSLCGENVVYSEDPFFEIHRLNQDWSDYPYYCYELKCDDEAEHSARYLMYRGSEIGVGIASHYYKVPPEIAHSLVKRADALKSFIKAQRDHFVDGSQANLGNEPPLTVIPIGKGRRRS